VSLLPVLRQGHMDTLSFLQRVLPTEGFFVTTVINTDGRKQGFFSSVDDLAKAVVGLDQRGNNTYFAISSFMEKGNRKQENVRATKVFALDVDCGEGKPFPSWREGLQALGKFVQQLKLPKPMIIHSGNGLHVYWVLAEALAPAQWKPLAEAMKAAAKDKGFEIDPAVPADSARVLRPVGTKNPKGNQTVRLLLDAPPVAVEQVAACLSAYMVAHPVSHSRSTSGSMLAQALQVQTEFPPAAAAVVAAKCQQIGWGVRNQGEASEPFWYGMMGVAAYCHDADATAMAWSEQHPAYSANETLRKMTQWKNTTTGPTTCNKLEELRPGGCKGCKFKDKVGTPARLGIQYLEAPPPTTAPDSAAVDIPVPRPFKRTVNGMKMTIDDTDIDVCPFDIYPVSYGRDEGLGYETVRFHWNRPHRGWCELTMRQAYLTTPRIKDFTTEVADQGIVLSTERQTEYFQIMLRSYMNELRQKRAMTNLYATMGWKENFHQFVIGDTILRRNGDGTVAEEAITLASTSQRLGHELWDTAGTLEAWVQFTGLMEKAGLTAHMFALGVSLSAPFYAFTGLHGLTVSLYGPTGGGKTLAQYWQQSVWGKPDKLHFAAKFTQNTLFGRMGLYCHLPMTIDEATMVNDKEVGDFLYWVSQGRDKARMNRNAEERDAKTWATPTTISTNKSWQSKLIASGLDTDAQMARLLEINVPVHPMFDRNSEAGRRVYNFLMENHGLAGRVFLTKLLELGPDGIRAAIAEATSTFHKRYKSQFSGSERYWEQAIILADLALGLCRQWGLIAFDHHKGIEWVLAQMGAIRRAVTENKVDAFDLLTEYLNDTADSAVTVMHTATQKPTIDFSRIPRADIRVRFDIFRKTSGDQFDHGTVMLDRTHFRRWLAQRGADYKTFLNELSDEQVVATPRSNKAYLGKDTPIKLGQSYVIGVNLNHPRLQGILDDADQAAEDLAYGQIKAVT
jgi:hypothetical protein